MSVKEFHHWLKYPLTKFSERVFGMLDLDNSGFLDFNEFLIGVWNWNTYDATGITKLAFNTMDVDQKGSIDLHEADAMLRMVYASRKADPLLLKQIDINGDGEVSMEELQQTVEEDNSVLGSASRLQ